MTNAPPSYAEAPQHIKDVAQLLIMTYGDNHELLAASIVGTIIRAMDEAMEAEKSRLSDEDGETVVAIAKLYGNFIEGHGWTGFGPTPSQISAAIRNRYH